MSTATPLRPAERVPLPPWRPPSPAFSPKLSPERGLTAAEWRRRAFHMLPGLLPVILWYVPHRVPLSPTLRGIILGVLLAVCAAVWLRWRGIRRTASNAGRSASILGYAGGVLLTLFLFPDRPECGFAVLGVLAFGDGSATIAGGLLRGPRLPWNPAKTWAGLAGFVLAGVPATALMYWGESHNAEAVTPAATLPVTLAVAAAGVLPAAAAESIHSRVNDNVRVAAVAALGILAAHAVRLGGAF